MAGEVLDRSTERGRGLLRAAPIAKIFSGVDVIVIAALARFSLLRELHATESACNCGEQQQTGGHFGASRLDVRSNQPHDIGYCGVALC